FSAHVMVQNLLRSFIPRRGMLLKLCTLRLKGHCRTLAAYQKKSLSSSPPTTISEHFGAEDG
ncbi:MAG: hypothetical protein VXU50_07525, partial [Verrucomicrobiota bacterium]|nr:hypothetical protein [Verrucomicrobiota bacterium]